MSVIASVLALARNSVVRMPNPELLSDFSAQEAIEDCFRAQGQFAGSTERQEGVPKLLTGNQLASRSLHLCLKKPINDFGVAQLAPRQCVFEHPHQFLAPSQSQLAHRKSFELPTELLQPTEDGIHHVALV